VIPQLNPIPTLTSRITLVVENLLNVPLHVQTQLLRRLLLLRSYCTATKKSLK
jgi:hypothetical protein